VHGTPAAGVSQTLRRRTRNGIAELSQRAPPIFGKAAVTLVIDPHFTSDSQMLSIVGKWLFITYVFNKSDNGPDGLWHCRSVYTWHSKTIYTVSQKKGSTVTMAITLSILDRFAKSFHCCKNFEYNSYQVTHHTLSMLLHYRGKLKNQKFPLCMHVIVFQVWLFITYPTCICQMSWKVEMWANAQRDGRPAEYRCSALCSTPQFVWHPLLECRAVTLPRRETRWNYLGAPN